MIAWSHMHVARRKGNVELARHGLRLGNLLGLQALALEHVLEIRVAAEIELIGPVETDAALAKQVGQDAMDDGGSDLALDVVAHDRKATLLEALAPFGIGRDE